MVCIGSSQGRARFNVPPNTQVISGTGFYRSNDPTNSVKALKDNFVQHRREDRRP